MTKTIILLAAILTIGGPIVETCAFLPRLPALLCLRHDGGPHR